MQKGAVRVVARVLAKQNKVEELHAILRGLFGPTRREAGCLSYELLRNEADPTDFTFIETWSSRAAMEAHLTRPHVRQAAMRLPELAAAPLDLRCYANAE
ncbi:antibiotic biosynthesis monooxygenase [Nitrospirales bacterium NOB]|nr:hypothetical protein [Nitrospirota bacterium]MDL1889537.1 antibiotic biosynthesis monooxygenase [Nitrospirales bacterium NOB]QOJ34169.1 MAG: antibiotic biosynthesis monooxygenase [Nitrospira sp.]